MARLKIKQSGFTDYTGSLYSIDFTNGISNGDVPDRLEDQIAANILVVRLDGSLNEVGQAGDATTDVGKTIRSNAPATSGSVNSVGPETMVTLRGRGRNIDLTDALQAAIDAASAKGALTGERIDIQLSGVFGVRGLTMRSNVGLIGVGRAALRLLSGSNKTVIEGLNFKTLLGTNTALAVQNWAIKGLKIDGNRAGNPLMPADEGHGVAIYGRDFDFSDNYVTDTVRKAVWLEYSDGSVGISPFNGRVFGVTVDRIGEDGLVLGVSDAQVDDINVRSVGQNTDNTYAAIKLVKAAHIGTRINVWRGGTETNKHAYSLWVTAGAATSRIDCVLETAGVANVRLDANDCNIALRSYNCVGAVHFIVNGHENKIDLIFFKGGLASAQGTTGLQLGDTLAARNNRITVVGITAPNGIVDFANSGGGNVVSGQGYLASGTDVLHTGTPDGMDDVFLVGMASLPEHRKSLIKRPFDETNFKAFGTTFSNATPLLRARAKVSTDNTSGSNGIKLTQAIAGNEHIVTNVSTVPLWVYPHSAGKFVGLAVNEGVQIPVGATWIFINIGFDWAIIKSA